MTLLENNWTVLLLLLFLLITFLQSGLDKILDWKGNLGWLKGHFSKSALKNMVPFLLAVVVVMEILTSVYCIWGMYEILILSESDKALCAATLSCVTLLMLLFGQRMAKDYDGARTIVIYLVPAILLVFFLEMGMVS